VVALVGSSGAGKSTIAALVPRLYDVDSAARRAGRVDVRDLTLRRDPRRRRRGHPGRAPVPRHDPGQPALRPSDGQRRGDRGAVRRARLGELLDALPDGLDTVVGERGYRLSGGERQRLTIARLLLAGPGW
jgi:ABC-type multidrug transport system fused ATPase/permease subunit